MFLFESLGSIVIMSVTEKSTITKPVPIALELIQIIHKSASYNMGTKKAHVCYVWHRRVIA